MPMRYRNPLRNPLVALWLAFTFTAPAWAGVVQTLDGATYKGEVHLAAPSSVTVTAAQGRPQTIELANVAYASVDDTPVLPRPPARAFESWLHQDIGVCDTPGVLDITPHIIAIYGSGVDIGYKLASSSDNFHFAFQQLCGDGEIVAQVLAFNQVHREARVGLMFRDTLDANSANVMAYLSGPIAGMQYRLAQGDPTARIDLPAKVSLPSYLKLVRRGNTFSAYRSTGGRDWVLLGEQEVPLARTLYVGLGVTSRKEGRICLARFNHVKIRPSVPAVDAAQPAASILFPGLITAAGSALPGQIVCADGAELRFARKDAGETIIPTQAASRLILQPLRPAAAAGLDPNRPGFLLATGDFIDGDLAELSAGKARITSILFGPRVFDLAAISAITLRPLTTTPARYRLTLTDGSTLAAHSLRITDSAVEIQDPSGARLRISPKLLSELRAAR